MDWQNEARRRIGAIHAALPETATLAERRSALRAAAYDYHGGTSWGRRTWGKHCRKYLEQHGQKPRTTKESAPLFADDIIFPYAKGSPA